MEEIKRRLSDITKSKTIGAIDYFDKLNWRLKNLVGCLTCMLEGNVYICNVSMTDEVADLLDKM